MYSLCLHQKRKQQQTKILFIQNNNKPFFSLLYFVDSINKVKMNSVSQGQVKYDSSSEDESSKKKRRILPATKSNGLYLLQKFSSPNLESDRITVIATKKHISCINICQISTHKKAFSLDKVNSIQLNRGGKIA